jgi:Tol biopolymer transport system component
LHHKRGWHWAQGIIGKRRRGFRSRLVPGREFIAFNALRGDGSINIDIFVMNTDGRGRRRITEYDDHDEFPTWSPDGARIAFESDLDGNEEIFTIDVNGTNLRRLTYNDADDGQPSYSRTARAFRPARSRDSGRFQ